MTYPDPSAPPGPGAGPPRPNRRATVRRLVAGGLSLLVVAAAVVVGISLVIARTGGDPTGAGATAAPGTPGRYHADTVADLCLVFDATPLRAAAPSAPAPNPGDHSENRTDGYATLSCQLVSQGGYAATASVSYSEVAESARAEFDNARGTATSRPADGRKVAALPGIGTDAFVESDSYVDASGVTVGVCRVSAWDSNLRVRMEVFAPATAIPPERLSTVTAELTRALLVALAP